MSEFATVLHTPDLGPGHMAPVNAHGRDIAVVNVGQTYFAIDATCPVDGANLARVGRLDDDIITCPNDHARFSVRTGERIDSNDEALQSHVVRIEGNEIRVGPPKYADDVR